MGNYSSFAHFSVSLNHVGIPYRYTEREVPLRQSKPPIAVKKIENGVVLVREKWPTMGKNPVGQVNV